MFTVVNVNKTFLDSG